MYKEVTRSSSAPPITSFHPKTQLSAVSPVKTLLLSFFQSFNASQYRTPIRITNIANATALSLTATSSLSLY